MRESPGVHAVTKRLVPSTRGRPCPPPPHAPWRCACGPGGRRRRTGRVRSRSFATRVIIRHTQDRHITRTPYSTQRLQGSSPPPLRRRRRRGAAAGRRRGSRGRPRRRRRGAPAAAVAAAAAAAMVLGMKISGFLCIGAAAAGRGRSSRATAATTTRRGRREEAGRVRVVVQPDRRRDRHGGDGGGDGDGVVGGEGKVELVEKGVEDVAVVDAGVRRVRVEAEGRRRAGGRRWGPKPNAATAGVGVGGGAGTSAGDEYAKSASLYRVARGAASMEGELAATSAAWRTPAPSPRAPPRAPLVRAELMAALRLAAAAAAASSPSPCSPLEAPSGSIRCARRCRCAPPSSCAIRLHRFPCCSTSLRIRGRSSTVHIGTRMPSPAGAGRTGASAGAAAARRGSRGRATRPPTGAMRRGESPGGRRPGAHAPTASNGSSRMRWSWSRRSSISVGSPVLTVAGSPAIHR